MAKRLEIYFVFRDGSTFEVAIPESKYSGYALLGLTQDGRRFAGITDERGVEHIISLADIVRVSFRKK